MKTIPALVIILLLSFPCLSCGHDNAASAEAKGQGSKVRGIDKEGAYKKGEILVRFKEKASDNEIAAINKENGAEVLEFIKGIKAYRLRIISNKSVEEMVKIYSLDPRVEYAEPNYIQRAR